MLGSYGKGLSARGDISFFKVYTIVHKVLCEKCGGISKFTRAGIVTVGSATADRLRLSDEFHTPSYVGTSLSYRGHVGTFSCNRMLFVLVSSKSVVHIGLRSSAHCRLMQARMAAAGSPATTTPSLSHATDLLRELRQAIRKVEVTPKAAGTAPTSAAADVAEDTQTVWTTNAIEVCFIEQ